MKRLLSFVIAAALMTAAPHRLQEHPNSLTVFSMAEGPDGLLWLAAADGLYRFDGFHYDKIAGYPFVSAYSIGFTRDGALWVAGFEGVARMARGEFKVMAREHVVYMTVTPEAAIVRFQDGMGRVGLDGRIERFGHMVRRDLLANPADRVWAVCVRPQQGCWIDMAKPRELHTFDLMPGLEYLQVAPGRGSSVWEADSMQAVLVENGHEVRREVREQTREMARPGPLVLGREGRLWFIGETVRELNSGSGRFEDRADAQRFTPLAGFEDSKGHVWVSSLGRGLVEWIPDAKWQRWFPENFSGEPVVQVVRDAGGAAVAATEKNLYRLDAAGKWVALMKEQHRFDSVMALADGGFLASTRDVGVARISAEGRIVERLKDLFPEEQYREIVRDKRGRIWVGTKHSLLRVEGAPGSLRFRTEVLPEVGEREPTDAVALELAADGKLWAGYSRGLAWLDDDDRWHKIATDQPVTLVRSFGLAPDGIWVTYRRSGEFSRLNQGGDQWKVTALAASAGYTPVNSYFIKRDSRGWIWRGSPEGVFVADGVHFEANDWIHLSMENGLAANEMSLYGFFEDRDGSVWLSGDEGLTHVTPDRSWFGAAGVPHVTGVEADGRAFVLAGTLPAKLGSDTKVVRISLGSLNAPAFRDAAIRYRLSATKEWALSRDGVLEFRDLPSGAYKLEFGFVGGSETATYELQIGTVVSWQWPVGFLLAAGVLGPVIRYAPWLERTRFRMAKGWFVLRRRFGENPQSSSERRVEGADHSGEVMAGRYRLLRPISRGGFSQVYEARDEDAGATVAVKVLNRAAGAESRVRDRFAHEVAALRSVDHPGVVRILDSWISAAGEPCLAMPFLEGPTLRSVLSDGPMERARVVRIVRQAGAALAEVHRKGIVHRDLKPENVMLVGEQTVIIDFGTAGLRVGDHELAATTLMAGSFFYMAPERLTGHYSAASDVFSLGVIVLEMLTGKRLNDLKSMVSEEGFGRELARVVRSAKLAEVLGAAFDPHPQKRPGEIGEWAVRVAAEINA